MRKKRISHKEIAKKFDSVAETFDKISNEYTVTRRYNEILKHIKGKCLEVGAGTGKLLSSYNDKKHILTDISYKMCKVASSRHNKVVCCDAQKLPFHNNTFDTIISSEVVYYLNNPELFVKESHRLLKRRGKLIISSANQDMQIYDKIRKFARKMGVKRMYFDDPINSFVRLKDLEKLLKKNKLKIKVANKIILLPFKSFHKINVLAEKTFLKHFSVFIFIVAEKE